jgi:hypothetical protein
MYSTRDDYNVMTTTFNVAIRYLHSLTQTIHQIALFNHGKIYSIYTDYNKNKIQWTNELQLTLTIQ